MSGTSRHTSPNTSSHFSPYELGHGPSTRKCFAKINHIYSSNTAKGLSRVPLRCQSGLINFCVYANEVKIFFFTEVFYYIQMTIIKELGPNSVTGVIIVLCLIEGSILESVYNL